ncbi:multidrug resistance protein 1-like [Lingula anatina]|uniref:Multidrug resistance protein 1-like n=1 Tax=Lingula anatina TaxID=7574 RepID=A0A2R2MP23_LINAN|nr:multidrug resistance protein 1-like [Lingula anatina]|eukprot:XP_023931974.1 multidrug resistance protein 1-like [Lingula anatina]
MAPTVEEKQRLLAEDEGVEPVVKKSYGSSTHESSGSSSDVSIEGKEKEKEKLKPASFGKLFRYATKFDVLLILVGTLFAIAHGAAFPMLMVVFGDMTDTFIMNSTSGAFNEEMTKFTLQYVYIGAGCFVASYIQIACWMSACERQVLKLRKTFFFCILRQEIGWFDQNPSGELSTRLVDDIERVREGLGDKFSQCIQFLAQFVAGFAFGFWKGWKMALVMMSLTPLLAVASAFMSKVIASYSTREQQAYAAAGSVAEEVLSSIRTVVSFRGQKKEIRRYNKELETSSKLGVKKSVVTGLGMGLTFLILYGAYALAFWYGATLIEVFYNTLGKDGMSPGSALTVFFCIMIGSFSIGNAAPHLASVATAKGAAATLYKVIDNIPIIDASSNDGIKIPDVKGNIEFCDVKFAYPSRPDVKILKGLSFTVPSGRTVALVGSSGCGKSTAVNLIQRFYDPEEGRILLDGNDLKNVNTRWLRQNIGVVSQEPILFGCSIIDNIRYGRLDVTYEEIIRAAKDANAHDFINRLPDGYDTLVGERGIQLSGGQKQRVAIARALVRDPKILLLDEATSALDAESEAVVQAALDKAREGRTTVVIAHRLSTIQSADQICVVQEGQVMEQGGHRELMNKEGLYYQLVTLQKLTRGDEESDKEEDGGEEGGVKEGERPRTPGLMRSKSLHRSHSKQTPGVLRQTSVKKKKTVEEEAKEEEVVLPGFCRILRLNKPEACHIVTGCIGGALVGGVMPAFAFFYGELIAAYTKTGETLLRESTFWSMMFLALGGVSFIGVLVNSYSFGVSGEKLTKRLRLKTFDNILRQDIAWFDDPRQATGALTTRLATDASLVKTGTGVRLGIIVQSAVSMIGGLTIAFIYGWALALLVLGTVPLMAVAGALNMKAISGRDKKDNEALEQAGKTASEAIENIRTVQSLTREPTFYDGYCNKLLQPFRENLKQAQFYGIAYGFSQGIIFFIYAGTFRFGAYLVDIGMMDPPDVYK